jgi:hypothetical protein
MPGHRATRGAPREAHGRPERRGGRSSGPRLRVGSARAAPDASERGVNPPARHAKTRRNMRRQAKIPALQGEVKPFGPPKCRVRCARSARLARAIRRHRDRGSEPVIELRARSRSWSRGSRASNPSRPPACARTRIVMYESTVLSTWLAITSPRSCTERRNASLLLVMVRRKRSCSNCALRHDQRYSGRTARRP